MALPQPVDETELLFVAGMWAAAALAALGATFLDHRYRSWGELLVTGGLCGALSAAIVGLTGLVDDWIVFSRMELLCVAVLVGSIGSPLRDFVAIASKAALRKAIVTVGGKVDDKRHGEPVRRLPGEDRDSSRPDE